MKKLITIILIMALLLPAAALADDTFRITEHYTVLIDGRADEAKSAKGDRIFTDFDSKTIDLYLASDSVTGYYIETTCIYDTFINSGMCKIKKVELNGQQMLVDDAGNSISIITDEDGNIWINVGQLYVRMKKAEPVNTYYDIY